MYNSNQRKIGRKLIYILISSMLIHLSSCLSSYTDPINTNITDPPGMITKSGETSVFITESPNSAESQDTDVLIEPKTEEQGDFNIEEYFNGTLFIGDSIMEGIRQYVAGNRKNAAMLGDAKFLTSTMGIAISDLTGKTDRGIYYSYKGEKTPICDICEDLCPKRVFLMLGLNDLTAAAPITDDIVMQYKELIGMLKSSLPEAEILIISNTPKVSSSWLPSYIDNRNFNNLLIDEFNSKLKNMCENNNIGYIDVNTPLKGADGALPDSYCRDGYVHLNNDGSKIVVDTLYEYALKNGR